MGSNRRGLNKADPLKSWIAALVGAATDTGDESGAVDAPALVAAAAERAFDRLNSGGVSLAGLPPALPLDGPGEPPGGWANPWLPGLLHEQAVSTAVRQRRGAWYTPPGLVHGLIKLVDSVIAMPSFALDPTCGGGAFLLAVLDHWVERGLPPETAFLQVAGFDIDHDAAAVCRLSLELWAAKHGFDVDDNVLQTTIRVGDALSVEFPGDWPDHRLVIGNPPFATPLKTAGGRSLPATANAYRLEHADELGHYADLAAIHLHRAIDTATPGSPVMLVVPQSVLSSRDVTGLRARVASESTTVAMWAAREAVFDAGVRACAPVVVAGDQAVTQPVLAVGSNVKVLDRPGERTGDSFEWAINAARSLGAPPLPEGVLTTGATLGDLCTATAGFRDEYYGLVAATAEWNGDAQSPNRLVTVGSVEPLATTWGAHAIKLGGRQWAAPYVRTDRLDDKVRRWADRQAVPKLVVATQSKLIEPVLDPEGTLVPSTPLLSVHAKVEDLAHVAAVLLAPPVVAFAWQRWFGSALAVDALKLAANQLLELPLPVDRREWNRAADLIVSSIDARPGGLSVADGWSVAAEVATVMNGAFRADPEVLSWWLDRAPVGKWPGLDETRSVS